MVWTTCRRAATVVILMVLVFTDAVSVGKADVSFSFPSQNGSNVLVSAGDVANMGDSYRMNTGSVTDSGSNNSASCGRVVFGNKIRMLDHKSGTAASFNTSFAFSFESNLDYNESTSNSTIYCGDGMVFAFYPDFNIGEHERRLMGGGFGFHNFSRPNERQFSVEIDSYNNYPQDEFNDFSDSHIGVNFGNENVSSRYDLCNSTTCATQYNLCTDDIIYTDVASRASYCRYFCKGKTRTYMIWIDYDDVGQTLQVRFSNTTHLASGGKPTKAMIVIPNLRLIEFLDKEIEMYYVGFSASTGSLREVHTIKSWDFVSTGMPDEVQAPSPSPSPAPSPAPIFLTKRISMIAGISAAIVATTILGILYFGFIVHRKRRKPQKNLELESFFKTNDTLRAFTFSELSRSTKNFSAGELLSSGAFGDVYRGILPSGELIAVKRIKENQENGEESFLAEATSLKQIRHRNLLHLRGWSHSRQGLFLIYDYMCNGSLDKWIHRTPNRGNESQVSDAKPLLSWNARRVILAGLASGLEYLHGGWMQCVLHRDIKSSNVLLDADFNAYLGDFGLARLIDHHKLQKTTLLAGTLGYMAPEMQFTGTATKETDVYAFGILVLEVTCGRRPLDHEVSDPADFVLLESVWRAHEVGNISKVADPKLFDQGTDNLSKDMDVSDPSIASATFEEKMMMQNSLHLGLLCCLPNPSERPSMRVVNQWFQASEVGPMDLPPLPATKPHYVHHHSASLESFSEGTSSSTQSSGINHSSFQTSTSSGTR
ncbi:hypothetical protein KC19_1G183600 [Ceratodon purpureus]|uniref:Protein kinase domain-containing protein n=1 Tax=Ceratodon purpureus TaxID=3225 RepID=A0A8T0JA00_CERPU|nr:hypothetical protein KC19_1G183600 [Ceratodon purpureus]